MQLFQLGDALAGLRVEHRDAVGARPEHAHRKRRAGRGCMPRMAKGSPCRPSTSAAIGGFVRLPGSGASKRLQAFASPAGRAEEAVRSSTPRTGMESQAGRFAAS